MRVTARTLLILAFGLQGSALGEQLIPNRSFLVDLVEPHTLETFFAAGLVPRRESVGDRYRCHLPPSRISFVIDGKVLPEIDFDNIGITVNGDGVLNKVSGRIGALPLRAAGELGFEVSEALGIPGSKFREHVSDIERGNKAKPEGVGNQYRFSGGTFSYGIGTPSKPGFDGQVGFGVTISFGSKAKKYSISKVPLRAPEGYEHLSMEPFSDEESKRLREIIARRLSKRTIVAVSRDGKTPPASKVETPIKKPTTKFTESVEEEAAPAGNEEETIVTPSGSNTGFAVGLAAGALALFAGAWFVPRRKPK